MTINRNLSQLAPNISNSGKVNTAGLTNGSGSKVTKTATSTPPTNPIEGDIWLDTTTGIWSMYFTSGNGITSAGWIEIGRP